MIPVMTKKIPKKKTRKVTDGPIKNKERTKQKLIQAVGQIFEKEGYAGLNTVKIARASKVDRKLIYLYFGSLENLIERYFMERDFWIPPYNEYISKLLIQNQPLTRENILTILKGQLENMMTNKIFQKTILWEISEKNKLTRAISDERENVGEQLFKLTEGHSNTDLRAILALQIAGIYYLALHAKINGSTFCGIDINQPEGKKRIEKALAQILADTYDAEK